MGGGRASCTRQVPSLHSIEPQSRAPSAQLWTIASQAHSSDVPLRYGQSWDTCSEGTLSLAQPHFAVDLLTRDNSGDRRGMGGM